MHEIMKKNHHFLKVIGNRGLLRRKTRILITKEPRFLQHTDYILVMKNQSIVDSGTFEELNARHAIIDCILEDDGGIDDVEINENNRELADRLRAQRRAKRLRRMDSTEKYMQTQRSVDDLDLPYSGTPTFNRRRSSGITSTQSAFPPAATCSNLNNKYNNIEDLSYDNVTHDVYLYYAKALGIAQLTAALLFYLAYQVFEVASKLWLSSWASTRSMVEGGRSTGSYITTYGVLGLMQSLAFLAAILLVNQRAINASMRLHQSIFHKVLHCTIEFAWSTPVGKIVNRFSKDMDETDVILPNTFKNFLNQTLRIAGTIFIVMYTYPSIVLTVIPLSFLVIWVLKTYIKTSRMMRRMSAASMSVVNTQLAETTAGVSTIRAHRQQPKVIIITICFCNPFFDRYRLSESLWTRLMSTRRTTT